MEAIESLVYKLRCAKGAQGVRLRRSLVAFTEEYARFEAQAKRRLAELLANYERHQAALATVERDLGRFQRMIEWWAQGSPPTPACIERVTDANKARSAIVDTHRWHSCKMRQDVERQASRDARLASQIATHATLTHIDWLRSTADVLGHKFLESHLNALAIVVQSGYSTELLFYFVDVWTRHHDHIVHDVTVVAVATMSKKSSRAAELSRAVKKRRIVVDVSTRSPPLRNVAHACLPAPAVTTMVAA